MGAPARAVGKPVGPGSSNYLSLTHSTSLFKRGVVSGARGLLQWVVDGGGHVLPRWVDADGCSSLLYSSAHTR